MAILVEKKDPRFYQINDIFLFDNQKQISRDFSPRFYTYFKSFFKDPYKFERYFLGVKNIFQIIEAEDKRVLDTGCGFGLIALSMALLGVSQIVGIDEDRDKIRVFSNLISRLDPTLKNIRAEVGDVLNLQHKNDSFDIVIAIGVLSHLRDLNSFFVEVRRVLKKKGRLYIAMSNNSLNIGGRIFRRKFWKSVEFGHVDTTIQPSSYFEMRKAIIKQHYPLIKNEDLVFLAKETQGMYGQQIPRAVEDFLREGKITQKPLFKFRHPYSGQIPEAELNPYGLIKLLTNFGFQAKIIPPFTCNTYPFKNFSLKSRKDILPIMKIYIKKIVKLCNPVSLLFSHAVEIIATKNK